MESSETPTADALADAPPAPVGELELGPDAPVTKSGTRRPVVVAIGFLLALSLIAFGAAAFLVWLRAPDPRLARFVPKDVVVYVEMPSSKRAGLALLGMRGLDARSFDPQAELDKVAREFGESFDMRRGDASALLSGVESMAMAVRDTDADTEDRYDEPQSVVLARFSSREAFEPFLRVERVERVGKVRDVGITFRVLKARVADSTKEERPVPSDLPSGRDLPPSSEEREENAWRKLFDGLGEGRAEPVATPKKEGEPPESDEVREPSELCLWVADERLLACGDQRLVNDVAKVVAGEAESLESANPRFDRASWPSGAVAVAFVDDRAFGLRDRHGVLAPDRPITGSMRFVDEGWIIDAHLETSGDRAPPFELFPASRPLDLDQRLPADTIAYVEASGQLPLDGKEYTRALTAYTETIDVRLARRLDAQLSEWDERLGIGLDTILDATENQVVLGLVADPRLSAEDLEDEARTYEALGLVGIAEIDDQAKVEKLMRAAREELEYKDQFEVKTNDAGFTARPREDDSADAKTPSSKFVPFVSVSIRDGYLLVAIGSKRRIHVIEDAFTGEGERLGADKAHDRARRAVGRSAQAVVWFDLARGLRLFFKKDPETRRKLKERGFAIDSIELEGDERVTAAAALRVTQTDHGSIEYELETLNAVPAIGLGTYLSLRNLLTKTTPRRVTAIPATGVTECDDYLKTYADCFSKLSPDDQRAGQKDFDDTVKMVADSARLDPDTWKPLCSSMKVAAQRDPKCK
ncbi:MAG: hypothetical protein U0271_19720 [Polyangiaceae bacterium]